MASSGISYGGFDGEQVLEELTFFWEKREVK